MSTRSQYLVSSRPVVLLVICCLIPGFAAACSPRRTGLAPLPLTPEQRLDDFRFLCETILGGYPYLEAGKRMTGYDWAAHIPVFEAEIEAADSDNSYGEAVARILRRLNNAHVGIMGSGFLSSYQNKLFGARAWKTQIKKTTSDRSNYWYRIASNISGRDFPTTPIYAVHSAGQYVLVETAPDLEIPPSVSLGSTVMAVDGIPIGDYVHQLLGRVPLKYDPLRKELFEPVLTVFSFSRSETISESDDSSTVVVTFKTPDGRIVDVTVPARVGAWAPSYSWPPKYTDKHGVRSPSGNLYAYLVDGKIAYVQIRNMLSSPTDIASDLATLRQFMAGCQNLSALTLDIRGNSGGSDNYWESLVAMLAPGPVSATCGVTWRASEFVRPFMKDKTADLLPEAPQSELLKAQSAAYGRFPSEILSSEFVAPRSWARTVSPNKTLNYQGRVFLLVDCYVYSSAESFAAFCKGSKWATIIGSNTGGDGIGYDPVIVTLPNSGMVVRFPGDMGLNQDWTASEEFHTSPDILVEWKPGDLLEYINLGNSVMSPSPSWDPQLLACMKALADEK